jgi:hypothetical protein
LLEVEEEGSAMNAEGLNLRENGREEVHPRIV